MSLVLSLFPGIGLLDMAFEEEGFCVVRGPDLLWGGDVKRFHPPAGRFDGIIGGPPCQAHSTYAALNRARGNHVAEDLVPEYERVVGEARLAWFLMENVPGAPEPRILGYEVQSVLVRDVWVGGETSRMRRFCYSGAGRFHVETLALHRPDPELAALASEGRAGLMSHKKNRADGTQKAYYRARRDIGAFCQLQGLPRDFADDLPFTNEAKYRAIGNGVPLPMGRAVAKAVRKATASVHREQAAAPFKSPKEDET